MIQNSITLPLQYDRSIDHTKQRRLCCYIIALTRFPFGIVVDLKSRGSRKLKRGNASRRACVPRIKTPAIYEVVLVATGQERRTQKNS